MKQINAFGDLATARAVETARLLRVLANAHRLQILCRLLQHGEQSAGELATALGLSMSALSPHLALMRREGLLLQRRQSRQLFYELDTRLSGNLVPLLESICVEQTIPSGDPAMTPGFALSAVLGLALASHGAMAADGFWQTPTIHEAGKMHALPQAAYQPDAKADYKVVFGLTQGATDPARINPGLQRVARTVNLYVHAGVPLNHLHFVAVASGAATPIALDDAHYRQQYGKSNPNLPVIAELRRAGVDVAVCGQAIAEHEYRYEWVDKQVTLALSALTTITELQQKGYALMPL